MQHTIDNPRNEGMGLNEQRHLAETIRRACLQAALAGYEDASISGLCHEGAWECAIDAIRSLDLDAILRQMMAEAKGGTSRVV